MDPNTSGEGFLWFEDEECGDFEITFCHNKVNVDTRGIVIHWRKNMSDMRRDLNCYESMF